MKKLLVALLVSFFATTSAIAHRNCLADLESHFQDHELALSACGLIAQDMPKIIDFLSTHSVGALDLAYNHIGTEGAKILATHDSLVGDWLDLTSNNIGTEGAAALAKSQYIRWLLVADNNIGSDAIIQMAQNSNFVFLDLSYNHLDNNSINALSKMNVGLRIGGFNHFSPTDLAQLANHKTRLDIVDEPVNNESAKLLGQNKTLNTVFLYNNMISPLGFQYLADSKSIEGIYTFDNTIGVVGAAALAKDTHLEYLWIVNGDVGDEGADKLSENSTLSYLMIAKDNVSDSGALALAKSVVPRLALPANNIGTQGALALADDKNLIMLDLSENYSLGTKGLNALMNSKTLKGLRVSENLGWGDYIDLNPGGSIYNPAMRVRSRFSALHCSHTNNVCRASIMVNKDD